MSFSELPPVFVVGAVQEALMTPAWLEAVTRRIPLNVSPIARNQRTHRERNPSAFCLRMFTLSIPGIPTLRLTLRAHESLPILRLSTTEVSGGFERLSWDPIRVHRRFPEARTVEAVTGSSAPTHRLSRQ